MFLVSASSLMILASLHVSPASLDTRRKISRSSYSGVDGWPAGGRRARGLVLPYQVASSAPVSRLMASMGLRMKLKPALPGSISLLGDQVRPPSVERR